METATHGNNHGMNDLYIMPANEDEGAAITVYLRSQGIRHSWSLSNTPRQSWEGRSFIEIPFGEGCLEHIKQAIAAS